MKTYDQVNEIMESMPEKWRSRWCGGENGPCACLGCVYTGSKLVVAEKALGKPYKGDPERIEEHLLASVYPEAYQQYMLTRKEWEDWSARQQKG